LPIPPLLLASLLKARLRLQLCQGCQDSDRVPAVQSILVCSCQSAEVLPAGTAAYVLHQLQGQLRILLVMLMMLLLLVAMLLLMVIMTALGGSQVLLMQMLLKLSSALLGIRCDDVGMMVVVLLLLLVQLAQFC
jgi:hypothetical protein